MKSLLVVSLLTGSVAGAQTITRDFPGDAIPLVEASIQESFSGKTYSVKPVGAPSWKWQFKSDGYFFFNTSDGFSDSGKWTAKGGKLCTDGRRMGSSCNEIRKKDAILYYKRDNGDIVEMLIN